MFKYGMKEVLRDEITGFTGIVIARAEYMEGEKTYRIQPYCEGQQNKMLDAHWINEERLSLLNEKEGE